MKKFSWILAVGAVLGAWLSVTYICPSDGRITLTQAILQLSGSRGIFALGTSFTELLGFSLRLIPILAFQALAGIRLYRHYCVASVYVFSRIPGGLRGICGRWGLSPLGRRPISCSP